MDIASGGGEKSQAHHFKEQPPGRALYSDVVAKGTVAKGTVAEAPRDLRKSERTFWSVVLNWMLIGEQPSTRPTTCPTKIFS